MDRISRRAVGLFAGAVALVALTVPAQAERRRRRVEEPEEDGGLKRILVMPLAGPSGIAARNKIAERIETRADVVTIGQRQARQPARAARQEGADAVVGGRVRCPGRQCKVEVTIYRRNGRLWQKAADSAPRSDVADAAADLAEDLLTDLELLHEEVEEPPEEPPEVPQEEWIETEEPPDEPPPEKARRPRRGAAGARFKAIELSLVADLTVLRNLCMDVATERGNDQTCNLEVPTADDRTYTVTPYGSLGGRVVLFPAAFLADQRWYAHLGLYFDYSHSLAVSSQREYVTADGDSRIVRIGTSQQDLRVGAIGRIPISGPLGPQFRLFAGFGMYEFSLDDSAYPPDFEVSPQYHDSNPYLPTYTYLSIDVGAYFHYPFLDGMLRPYLSLAYRLGLSAGQAGEVFATQTSVNGVQGELGLVVELGWGIRLAAAMELIYYGTAYAGQVDWSGAPAEEIWAGTHQGEWSDDTVLRLRLLAGWSF